MKLTVFGRDPKQADIVLASDFVSSYHAELIQLDNNEMYLVDKSSNGTTINGMKLTPGKETLVHRGDRVMFADVPLNWNQVTELNRPANVKQVKIIGSHFTCHIKLQGAGVSRFHATLRQTTDNKWYICDYSKNGTTVNGQRLTKNNYVELKAGDEIVCAGIPIENPVPKKKLGKIVAISLVSIIIIVCATIGGIWWVNNREWPGEKIYSTYNSSIVLMFCGYHFEVECGLLDVSDLPDPDEMYRNLPSKFVIEEGKNGKKYIEPYDGDNEMFCTGTGFFIGKKGNIVTNLHVAKPWLAESISTSSSEITILSVAEEYYRQKFSDLVRIAGDKGIDLIQYIPQIKVTGVLDYCFILPNGNYNDSRNRYRCKEVISSNNINIDLAIMHLQQTDLPTDATYVPLDMISKDKVKQGEIVYTSGFPGIILHNSDENKQIQVNSVEGRITKNDDDYSFVTTAPIASGASGSPVFNKYGKLVGVMNAGISNKDNFNFGIFSTELLKLIEKANINE